MSKATQVILSFLFSGFLLLPSILFFAESDWYSGEEVSATENRRMAKIPNLALLGKNPKRFFKRVTAAVQDRLPIRAQLLDANIRLHYTLLNESGVSDVLLGEDEWLFFQDSFVRKFYRPADKEWDKRSNIWVKASKRKSRFLAERGAEYLFVVAPNKHSVYPENLGVERFSEHRWDRLDSLIEKFSTNASSFLSLRETLRSSKHQGRLYHRSDTHWNDLGATLAVEEIARRLGLDATPLQGLKREEKEASGDLAKIWGASAWFKEKIAEPKRELCQTEETEISFNFQTPLSVRQLRCEEGQKRILLVADSFGEALSAPLARISHTLYLAKQLPTFYEFNFLVETLSPDIVIELRVERMLAVTPRKGERLRVPKE